MISSRLVRFFGKYKRLEPFIPRLPEDDRLEAESKKPALITQHPKNLHDKDPRILKTEKVFYLTKKDDVDVRFYNRPLTEKSSPDSEKPPLDMQKVVRVAVVGLPNAGKSTLVNKLIGTKVSGVSKLAHTTWENTEGILSDVESGCQAIFVDTPGLVDRFDQKQPKMNDAWNAVEECDVVLFVIDAVRRIDNTTHQILDMLKKKLYTRKSHHQSRPSALVINKADILHSRRHLHDAIDSIADIMHFDKTFIVSSDTGFGIDSLKDYVMSNGLAGEWDFEPKTKMNASEVEVVEEFVREGIFNRYVKDIPFYVDIKVKQMAIRSDGVLKVHTILRVFNKNRVPILLGKNARGLAWMVENLEAKMTERYGVKVVATFSISTSGMQMKDRLRFRDDILDDKPVALQQEMARYEKGMLEAKDRRDPRKAMQSERISEQKIEQLMQQMGRLPNMDNKQIEEKTNNSNIDTTPKVGGRRTIGKLKLKKSLPDDL